MHKRIISGLALATLLLAAGCTKLELLDATIPNYGYHRKTEIAYGDKLRQTLDIYMPETVSEKPRPVIVFFYGGAWQRGTKEDYRFVGHAFAEKGYVTVVANYRLYPQVSFPAFVEDSALAVNYVHAHISEFGGDAENLFVAGHSAGAYNAMMLVADPRYLEAVGGNVGWIRGAIGLSGPYNFLPLEREAKVPHIEDIFKTAPIEQTQPVLCLVPERTDIPSVFLATGAEDDLVVPANTEAMAKRLTELGVNVEVHNYPGANHQAIAQALASSFHQKVPVFADMAAFIEHTKQ